MIKRTYSETQTLGPNPIPIPCQTQTRQFAPTNSLFKKFKPQDDTLTLSSILATLEKINTKLDACERKIEFIYGCQVKSEQEKIEQKIRDTEIFNSYIS